MVSDAVIGSLQARTGATSGVQVNNGQIGQRQDADRSPALQSPEQTQEQTRVTGTAAAQTQGSETRNNGQDNPVLQQAENENSTSVQFTGNEPRGSVVDLSV